MIFTDILLTSLAYASIIIATLRASSRLLYLLEHGSIGAMEGPLILGPNEMKDIASATPVWDLSYAFQQGEIDIVKKIDFGFRPHNQCCYQGVQLSLFPEFFEYRDHNGEIEYKGKEKSNYNLERTTNIVYNSTYGDYATAQVTAYAPGVFDDLRSRFGVTKESFQNSILNGSFISFQSNSKGAARVGGVFFFTRDGAYMIKTIKKEEVKTFQEMLPNYHEHMKKNGRKSLLTRFSGMFTVTIKHKKTERTETFVIMNSVFPPESSQFIAERYDLKGSTVGRECSEREKARKGSNAILKDLDLAREVELIRSYGQSRKRSTVAHGFKIGWRKKTALLSQLQKDVKFLIKSNVMDYSLLVGVVNMDSRKLDLSLLETLERSKALESKRRNRKGFKRAFYLSIIPIRILAFPFFSVGRRTTALGNNMLSTFLDVPLPYYGAGVCGVDGGAFSIIEGKKAGKRCLFYLGLIDFLQPWTSRKKLERKAKAVMGHNVHAISCVDPEEYGTRFLNFMEAHLS